jgi:hypothetical protein
VAALAEKAAVRVRPFRVSRGWPIKLPEAEERLRTEWYGDSKDAGPWALVRKRRLDRFLRPEREHRAEVVAGRITLGAARRQAQLLAEIAGGQTNRRAASRQAVARHPVR